jgi:hypothetical protein
MVGYLALGIQTTTLVLVVVVLGRMVGVAY